MKNIQYLLMKGRDFVFFFFFKSKFSFPFHIFVLEFFWEKSHRKMENFAENFLNEEDSR